MYTPKPLRMDNTQCLAFVRQHPFAIVVSGDDLEATHIPLQYAAQEQCFYGHVAKANSHWQSLDKASVLLIFAGPHGYISGHYYAKGPAVPTWNYASVHVKANAVVLPAETNRNVALALLKDYEADYNDHTTLYEPAYLERLSNAIVSLRFDIESMQGTLKLGQHKNAADQQQVWQALRQSDNLGDQQLAAFMQQWQLGTGQQN